MQSDQQVKVNFNNKASCLIRTLVGRKDAVWLDEG